MVKICPKCGNSNSDDAFWCNNCNSKIPIGLNTVQNKEEPILPREQKSYQINEISEPKNYEPKKKRRTFGVKFFLLLIILVLIIAIVIAGFHTLNSDEEKFIGTWRSSNGEGTMTFESGFFSKTFTLVAPTSTIKGNWRCENGIVYINFDAGGMKFESSQSYIFQDGKIILNGLLNGEPNEVIFTRI